MLNTIKTHVSDDDARAAFQTLLSWIGEDPARNGLKETPDRLVRAFQDYFSGYAEDPEYLLRKTFDEVDGYDEMVTLRGIPFYSHCEHHVAPIVGHAWVGYVPDKRVVGISKLARVVEVYARRLQIQERMTSQIANVIDLALKPKGVAVLIKAEHHCISGRGVDKHGVDLVTTQMLGCLRDDARLRAEFLSFASGGSTAGRER